MTRENFIRALIADAVAAIGVTGYVVWCLVHGQVHQLQNVIYFMLGWLFGRLTYQAQSR